jgi:corrinoid protein of di/trimethylamine methyltransferase
MEENMEKYLEKLYEAISIGDSQKAKEYAEKILQEGLDPLKAIEEAVKPAAKSIGEKFERFEAFLPDLIASADAMKIATDILVSAIKTEKPAKVAKVVMATVEGDIHDIGKNIVCALLQANGFEVYDLGVNVPASKIIEKAEEVKADIIGLSSMLTMSMEQQKILIKLLEELGLRDKYLVMVGGAPVTKEWCSQIGADGYGKDASEAVKEAFRLLEKRRDA